MRFTIDKEFWHEVISTLKQQKWRSIMTMFGVFWGIFMVMVLIGCGFGMKNGVMGNLLELSSNSVYFKPSTTTIPYNGLGRDRTWSFDDNDISRIEQAMGHRLKYITMANLDGIQQVSSGDRSGFYAMGGVSPTYWYDIPQEMVYGRYINEIDMVQQRKVVLLGVRVAAELFDDPNPCGEYVSIGGVRYLVVGIMKQTNTNVSVGIYSSDAVLIPFTTEQAAFGRQDEISMISVALYDEYNLNEAIDELKDIIYTNHDIAPEDKAAMESLSLRDAIKGYESTMSGIELLILIVGIGILQAGLVGIANIMLVTIKERTKEIGVRRALGAEPASIIVQILTESLVLTMTAGISGIVAGAAVLGILNKILTGAGEEYFTLIKNPMIPVEYALIALVVLVIGGLLAGFFPAKKALSIKAIDALRSDK